MRMAPTTAWYLSLVQRKSRSNHRKKGRNRKNPVSPVPCPFATGLRSDAQRTGVRISATRTDSSMAAMTVTEN